MSYEDWTDHFTTLFLNNDFPEDWTGVRFKSEWNTNNSKKIQDLIIEFETLMEKRYTGSC